MASVADKSGVDISAYAGGNGYLYTLIRLHKFQFYYDRFFTIKKFKTKETQ